MSGTTDAVRLHRESATRGEPADLQRSSWEQHAACATIDVDQELFFPEPETSDLAEPARAVCVSCPVRSSCLDFALARPGLYGVWGGLTTGERHRLRRRAQRAA
jgi:WhiB family redox-sensing transcriptional regulator